MEESTTVGDDPQNNGANGTTVEEPTTTTDDQTADKGDNLDSSKSTDGSAGGDNKPADEGNGGSPASKFDDDLDDWIDKSGRPKPDTDEQKQVLQDLRNSQRDFTRERQAAKDSGELGSAVKEAKDAIKPDAKDDGDLDPLEKRQNALEDKLEASETNRLQSEFYITNKINEDDNPGLAKAILDIYKEKTSRPTTPEGKKAAVDLWSNPESLSDLHDLAKARLLLNQDTSVIENEAAQKERERIAQESHAKGTGRSSTTPAMHDKNAEQERTERLKERYSTPKKS